MISSKGQPHISEPVLAEKPEIVAQSLAETSYNDKEDELASNIKKVGTEDPDLCEDKTDSEREENNAMLAQVNEEDKDEERTCDKTSGDDDPIPSGSGAVSRDCTASELIAWSKILTNWHNKLNQRPRGLDALIITGIPDPLRGEVWQLLSGAHQCSKLVDRYWIFLGQSVPTEQIILRDVHRTYPAHKNFRPDSGSSSLLDSLFKVCKAYAVYDKEIGYCQGLSFLVAALLLHMPEEQAFCVLVRIMQHYGLRNLFLNNFDELYLKFYQLERLIEDHMPDLHQHFARIGIEPFTYASQWFLTAFTAKFPLNAVYHIMDMFLLNGLETIFQISIALLSSSKQELLSLDFEAVIKYFRVQMPKLYRDHSNVQRLIVTSSEVSLTGLKRYVKDYEKGTQIKKSLENQIDGGTGDNSDEDNMDDTYDLLRDYLVISPKSYGHSSTCFEYNGL